MTHVLWSFLLACSSVNKDDSKSGLEHGFSGNNSSQFEPSTDASPASEPHNSGGWILRNDLSDEFDAGELNGHKWFRAGNHDNVVNLPDDADNEDGLAAGWVGRLRCTIGISEGWRTMVSARI